MLGYKDWRAAVPPGPVCRVVDTPYTVDPGSVIQEFPNPEVGEVHLNVPRGLWVDKTATDLLVSNVRRGFQFSFTDPPKPGLRARTLGVRPPLIFRVPAPANALADFIGQTPLAAVLTGP